MNHGFCWFTSLWLQVVDDTTFAMAGVQAKQWEEEKEVALKNAESACAKAIDVLLKQGAPESQLCVLHVSIAALHLLLLHSRVLCVFYGPVVFSIYDRCDVKN